MCYNSVDSHNTSCVSKHNSITCHCSLVVYWLQGHPAVWDPGTEAEVSAALCQWRENRRFLSDGAVEWIRCQRKYKNGRKYELPAFVPTHIPKCEFDQKLKCGKSF